MIENTKSLTNNLNEVFGQIRRATTDKRHPFRFLTFCTVSPNLHPEARMVVLRSFHKEVEIVIYTDRRSDKISAIRANDNCRLFFWHPKKRLQVSFLAKAEIHSNPALSGQLSEGAAKQYNSLLPPGSIIEQPEDAWVYEPGLTSANFCEVRCKLIQVDILQLSTDGHLRMKAERLNHNWEPNWVVP